MGKANPALREAAGRAFAAAGERDAARLAEDLFGFAGLLAREPRLRRALNDPGTPLDARTTLLSDIAGDRLTRAAMPVLASTLELQRTQDRDLVEVLEELGALAAFAQAESEGELDRMEDELFRVAVAIGRSPELQMFLADPTIPDDRKVAVVDDLLKGKAAPATAHLVRLVVEAGHSRDLARALEELVDLAAERSGALSAEVRTAVGLDAGRRRSLAETLRAVVGRPVRIQELVDPAVLGSLSVRVGDEVFDGSVKRQLELARERLGAA